MMEGDGWREGSGVRLGLAEAGAALARYSLYKKKNAILIDESNSLNFD